LIKNNSSAISLKEIKLIMGEKYVDIKNSNSMEKFTVQLMDPLLYDKLYILAAEYSISVETLINIAIKRFIEDIDFVRSLRVGKTI
ncbi:hypothetical protein, partial [Eisenbergiella tayi]